MEINKELTVYYRNTPSTIKYTFLSPDVCPNCHHAILPSENTFKRYYHEGKTYAYTVFICNKCYQPYMIWYDLSFPTGIGDYSTKSQIIAKQLSISPQSFSPKSFPEEISTISPRFVKIYNEALSAEQHGLLEICGAGYRKSLEILIKDYLITKDTENTDRYKTMSLSNCINSPLIHENIRITASRGAWFGNDQTHYEQKFKDKDISDLKQAIEVTQLWICMEAITNNLSNITPIK